jgi:2',3'-cyclic-nucleotide 2'-phosphodiesterase (5'-nucleotidase family)
MKNILVTVLAVLVLNACKQQYQLAVTKPDSVKINTDSLQLYDSATHYFIAPYKAKLDAQMNEVIGSTTTQLTKGKPESSLGNLVCDAAVLYASKNYNKPIDICVMNLGGIRLPNIEAGNITVGKVFELMPFDNMIEVLELKGDKIEALLHLIAAADGWPVAGVRMEIENGKATNISINNKPLDINQTYVLVTSDYVANGGDKADMLKQYEKRMGLNYLLRTSILDYVKQVSPLTIKIDGRITRKP